MKWTTDPVTQVLAKLRDSAALQGVDFCRAYPNQMKPSRLLRPVVAVMWWSSSVTSGLPSSSPSRPHTA